MTTIVLCVCSEKGSKSKVSEIKFCSKSTCNKVTGLISINKIKEEKEIQLHRITVLEIYVQMNACMTQNDTCNNIHAALYSKCSYGMHDSVFPTISPDSNYTYVIKFTRVTSKQSMWYTLHTCLSITYKKKSKLHIFEVT